MNKLIFLIILVFGLSGCNSMQSASAPTFTGVPSVENPALWQANSNTTWYNLQHTPLSRLQTAETTTPDASIKAWLALAIISKQYSTNTKQLLQELLEWKSENPNHPGNQLIPDDMTLKEMSMTAVPEHIVVLLPLTGDMAGGGQSIRNGFLNAYYDSVGHDYQKQTITFYDTHETQDIAGLYQKAVHEGADLIVGPLIKADVEKLVNLNQFSVQVLALNYTTRSFFTFKPINFYEFGLSPENEVEQTAAKARSNGLGNALVIASNDDWGHRVTSKLQSRWKSLGGNIQDSLYFTNKSNLTADIATLLHIDPKADRDLMREDNTKSVLTEQRRKDFDVIFLFAEPTMARQIVPLLKFYYAGNIPIYSISAIYSGQPNPTQDRDLNGVTFSEVPWVVSAAHGLSNDSEKYNRLYAIGRDAYLISQSLPRLNKLTHFPIYGSTGALEMDQQQIKQRMPLVTMQNGRI